MNYGTSAPPERFGAVGVATNSIRGDVTPSRPALEDINDKLRALREVASALAGRLENVADRALGGSLKGTVAANGGAKPALSGGAPVAFELLEEIGNTLRAAHEQADRLERVA
jgi:hypothetical protein